MGSGLIFPSQNLCFDYYNSVVQIILIGKESTAICRNRAVIDALDFRFVQFDPGFLRLFHNTLAEQFYHLSKVITAHYLTVLRK